MTVHEAAQKIGVSASLIYDLCKQGAIRHSRHGRPGKRGTIRISDEAVAEYMAACQWEPVPKDEGGMNYL